MIDIGIGRFLEMFEERFGRHATTCLLAVIGLGVLAVCLPLIWTNLFVPIFKASRIVVQYFENLKTPVLPNIVAWGNVLAGKLGLVAVSAVLSAVALGGLNFALSVINDTLKRVTALNSAFRKLTRPSPSKQRSRNGRN